MSVTITQQDFEERKVMYSNNSKENIVMMLQHRSTPCEYLKCKTVKDTVNELYTKAKIMSNDVDLSKLSYDDLITVIAEHDRYFSPNSCKETVTN